MLEYLLAIAVGAAIALASNLIEYIVLISLPCTHPAVASLLVMHRVLVPPLLRWGFATVAAAVAAKALFEDLIAVWIPVKYFGTEYLLISIAVLFIIALLHLQYPALSRLGVWLRLTAYLLIIDAVVKSFETYPLAAAVAYSALHVTHDMVVLSLVYSLARRCTVPLIQYVPRTIKPRVISTRFRPEQYVKVPVR